MSADKAVGIDSGDLRYGISLVLNLAIVVGEVVGGLAANSMGLLSDALHNLTDVGALALALAARLLSRRRPDSTYTYGYQRFEVMAGIANAMALMAGLGLILKSGIERLLHPQAVSGGAILLVGLVALVGNLLSVLMLHRHAKEDLGGKSAYLHLLQDALASLAVVVVGLLPRSWDLGRIDAAVSILVAVLVVRSAWDILRRSSRILMEASPASLDIEAMGEDIRRDFPEVQAIHHVHAWSLGSSQTALTAHVQVREDIEPSRVFGLIQEIQRSMADEWSISHATLQAEIGDCGQEECVPRAEPADLHHGHRH
jgi:cobalt-zinc-cadmium efflux system protein